MDPEEFENQMKEIDKDFKLYMAVVEKQIKSTKERYLAAHLIGKSTESEVEESLNEAMAKLAATKAAKIKGLNSDLSKINADEYQRKMQEIDKEYDDFMSTIEDQKTKIQAERSSSTNVPQHSGPRR